MAFCCEEGVCKTLDIAGGAQRLLVPQNGSVPRSQSLHAWVSRYHICKVGIAWP
jgi:hypothetical protein